MRLVIIGNSIVRDMRDSRWELVYLPGADWDEIMEYVLRHRRHLCNSFIYVHIGPVRFTRMHSTRNRREVVLRNTIPQAPWRQYGQQLAEYNIIPVLCTIYPMQFSRFNDVLALPRGGRYGTGRRGRQIMAFYQEWDNRIRGMVVIENRFITAFNEQQGMCAPFMYRTIFTRRRGTYAFRGDRFLRDGIHPTRHTRLQWMEEIISVHGLNQERWYRNRRTG